MKIYIILTRLTGSGAIRLSNGLGENNDKFVDYQYVEWGVIVREDQLVSDRYKLLPSALSARGRVNIDCVHSSFNTNNARSIKT